MKVVAMIPARYQASRFPGKLLKDLCGESVIMHTYNATINTKLFDDVYVVTDSVLIQEHLEDKGAQVLISQKQHETGSDRIAEVSSNVDADIIINVQGDEPFVSKPLLESIIDTFTADIDKKIDVVSLIFSITDLDEIKNPNNVKVVVDNQGYALYFSRAPIPYPREGQYAEYYQHIGVYGFRKTALTQFASLPMSVLEKTEKLENLRFLSNGMTVKMLLTNHKSIGIDTPEDLEKAKRRLQQKK